MLFVDIFVFSALVASPFFCLAGSQGEHAQNTVRAFPPTVNVTKSAVLRQQRTRRRLFATESSSMAKAKGPTTQPWLMGRPEAVGPFPPLQSVVSSAALRQHQAGRKPTVMISKPISTETGPAAELEMRGREGVRSNETRFKHQARAGRVRSSLSVVGIPVRSKLALNLIELFGLGMFGVDRFYIGGELNLILGVVKLLSCGGCFVWALMDYICVMINAIDGQRQLNALGMCCTFRGEDLRPAYAVAMVSVILTIFLILSASCECLARGGVSYICESLSSQFSFSWRRPSPGDQTADLPVMSPKIPMSRLTTPTFMTPPRVVR